MSFSGFTLDTLIHVTPGPFYISIHSNADRDSLYNIATTIASKPEELPHGRLIIGSEG